MARIILWINKRTGESLLCAHGEGGESMRIVIVEDEAAIREGMVKLLHQINPQYEVVGKANDGQSGYELIRSVRPDLIIVDIPDAGHERTGHDPKASGRADPV